MDNERMFDMNSFNDLGDASEVKSAVNYFAHNEIKYREQLASEGLTYEAIQKQVADMWRILLKLCSKYKYSDFIVETKKKLYSDK